MSAAMAVPALAGPDTSGTLSLQEAVGYSLDVYPTVLQAQAESRQAHATAGEQTADWFPKLSLSGSAVRYEEQMLVTPIHGFRPDVIPPFDATLYQGALSLQFKVFDGFGRSARISSAKAGARAADSRISAARQELMVRTATAYLGTLTAGEMLRAHVHRREALVSERERIRTVRGAGKAADVEMLRIEAALASAEAEKVRLEDVLNVAERQLARLTGLDPERCRYANLAATSLRAPMEGDRAALLELARAGNPEIHAARAQLQAAQSGTKAARSARWPALRLVGNYLGFASPEVDVVAEWNAGLYLTWPIFTGGATNKSIDRADASYEAARHQEREIELQIERALDVALAETHDAQSRVASLQVAADSYTEVARIEKLLLESGTGTQTDFLDAQADLLSARAGLAEAKNTYVLATLKLARCIGRLSPEWIAQHLEYTYE
jgi:outer membrane protein TolC